MFTPVKDLDSVMTNKGIFAPFSPVKNVDTSLVESGTIQPINAQQSSNDLTKHLTTEVEGKKSPGK